MKSQFKVLPAFLLLCLAITGNPVLAQSPSYDIDALSRASVQVRVENGTGSGTLLIIDDEPLVFTNRHVVEGFQTATISVLTDVNAPAVPLFSAELLGYSPEHDFAAYRVVSDLEGNPVTADHLRSDAFGFTLPELVIAGQGKGVQDVRRGDAIALLGYPGIGDDELVYTTGIVSSVQYGELNGQRLPLWYRTNAEMSPGNSGGLAVNAKGEFIAIPTSVRTESRTGGRLGNLLALPYVMALMEDRDSLASSWDGYTSPEEGSVLDYTQEPYFGEERFTARDLGSGFRLEMISGGSIDSSYLGNNCVGFAASSPDFRFQLADASELLTITFAADENSDDTTIVVNTPDGAWHCNDDFSESSLNPGLELGGAASGQYDVWIGSYNAEEFIAGTLTISDAGYSASSALGRDPVFNLRAEPHYGSTSLNVGFLPDPHRVSVTAGGSVNVSSQNLGSACTGYAASAPDFRINWSGNTNSLHFYFIADISGEDTTLLVNGADGQWHCNDDAHSTTLNPGISLGSVPAGIYDIWIGSYSEDEWISGELNISEITPDIP